MVKSILVPATGSETDNVTFASALGTISFLGRTNHASSGGTIVIA